MLGDGKSMVAGGLTVPAGDAGEAVGDVGDFYIDGGGTEEVEASAG